MPSRLGSMAAGILTGVTMGLGMSVLNETLNREQKVIALSILVSSAILLSGVVVGGD